MSFLSRLFGSAKPTRDVEAELKRLETEAQIAAPGYVGTAYNRAGDLALKSEDADRALNYYGRAIDAFLQDVQREAARGVANKIIRVRPSAVRTLCTLTWLDLAARHQATALLHLRDYVRAARDAGQHARAATQIFEMGRISADAEFVDAVADALDSLDFPTRAKEVRGWARAASPGAISDSRELGDACLNAAVRSNDRDQLLLVDVEPAESDSGDEVDESDVVDAADDSGDSDGADAVDDSGVSDETDAVDDSEHSDGAGAEETLDEEGEPAEGESDVVDPSDVPDDVGIEAEQAEPVVADQASDSDEMHAPVPPVGDDVERQSPGEKKKKKGKKSRKGRKNKKKKKK